MQGLTSLRMSRHMALVESKTVDDLCREIPLQRLEGRTEGTTMSKKNTPLLHGESCGPKMVACQVNMSCPAGPAEQMAGGSDPSPAVSSGCTSAVLHSLRSFGGVLRSPLGWCCLLLPLFLVVRPSPASLGWCCHHLPKIECNSIRCDKLN